jgi:hypothetical protein
MESRAFTAPDFWVPSLGNILLLCSGESPSGSSNVDRVLAQTILPSLTILLKFPKYILFFLSTSWCAIVVLLSHNVGIFLWICSSKNLTIAFCNTIIVLSHQAMQP